MHLIRNLLTMRKILLLCAKWYTIYVYKKKHGFFNGLFSSHRCGKQRTIYSVLGVQSFNGNVCCYVETGLNSNPQN